MEKINLTARIIVNEIDGYRFNGYMLDFLASFLDYCNYRTTWGVPRKHSPLDDAMLFQFRILTVFVSDIARETGFSNQYMYRLKETGYQYHVSVTPYVYDKEFEETYPSVDFFPTFDVSDPRDLEKLCNYIGVTFSPSFFE